MYTCSSQMLVHLFSSQVLLVVRHAFVLSLILNIGTGVLSVLFVYLFDLLSIDSFEPVSLFHLSFRWFVHALLSLWVVDIRSQGSFATPWFGLGELMLCDHFNKQSGPLSSVCCGSRFDLGIFFFLEAAVFFFQACSRHYKGNFCLTFQIDCE